MSELTRNDLFQLFHEPECSKISDLYRLEEDARSLSKTLDAFQTTTASGLTVQVADRALIPGARAYLRRWADELAQELNSKFNATVVRTPAVPLVIHWPKGAEFQEIQQGTAMVRGFLVLVGNRKIAYLGKEMQAVHLTEGFTLVQQPAGYYEVHGNEPEQFIEDGWLHVRFQKICWSKSGAWDWVHKTFGLKGKEYNPFVKNHSYYWEWTAKCSDLRNFKIDETTGTT